MQLFKKRKPLTITSSEIQFLDNLSLAILGFDKQNRLIYVSKYLKNQIGHDTIKTGITIFQLLDLLTTIVNPEDIRFLKENLKSNPGWNPTGTRFRYRLNGKVYSSKIILDTLSLKKSRQELSLYYLKEQTETTEPREKSHMTKGLAGNYYLQERLRNVFDKQFIEDKQTALILLSIDQYDLQKDALNEEELKSINLIIQERLKRRFPMMEIISHRWEEGRYAGIMPHVASISELVAHLNSIVAAFDNPILLYTSSRKLQVSMGITLYPSRCSSIQNMINQAEMALTIAARQGGNRYIIYSQELKEGQHRPYLIHSSLPLALEKGELFLKYQPRVNSRGDIISVESLLRWYHPVLGMVSPGEFIPLAEDSGHIIRVGEWVLKQACLQAKKWMDSGIDLVVSVNISPIQIHQFNSYKVIEQILADTGLPPERLELEVTEMTMMNHLEKTVNALRKIHNLGVRISLDDFGTGFSSLSYLGTFPVDILKIDQSFVKDIFRNNNHKSVVQAIHSLARSFRYRIIAEGVETEEQLEILKQIGCDEFQGFYYHKPMTSEEVENLYTLRVVS